MFHLAALLSTRSEFSPRTAHEVNVEGTLNLLEFAQHEAESHGRPVVFLYPSSIAAFGLPSLDAKQRRRPRARGPVHASDDDVRVQQAVLRAARPTTTRITTSSCRPSRVSGRVDFRAVRFPGLISADTVPSGGTSDYAPEMIHAAAKGEPYACFVRPDTRIPFMAMPDGVDALLALARAPRSALTQSRLQPRRLRADRPTKSAPRCCARFRRRDVTYKVDEKRQGIVDSWPEDVDDSAARARLGLRAEATTSSGASGST